MLHIRASLKPDFDTNKNRISLPLWIPENMQLLQPPHPYRFLSKMQQMLHLGIMTASLTKLSSPTFEREPPGRPDLSAERF